MLIHRMSANFGKLQGQTLELKDGLNIIQAPNETGKSTWCAFLSAMLYGINSRERDKAGFIAEKNRYAPWAGGAMLGRLDCTVRGEEISLLRATRRASAPMAEFKALYAGTGTVIPDLTGENCGEKLLGVSREVYERSAFIRQAGLAISQDAGLEKRIASLITSGEEGTSYTEAADALKKQLNRRRHNKTGQLPALEAQLAETEAAIRRTEGLRAAYAQSCARAEELEQQYAALTEELGHHHRWEELKKRQNLQATRESADAAQAHLTQIRAAIDADHIPENDAIGRLRGATVNLGAVRKSVEKARDQRDDAARALFRTEEALNRSPFAPLTPEQAARDAAASPVVHVSRLAQIAIFLAGLAAAGGAYLFSAPRVSVLGGVWQYLPWGLIAAIAAVGAVVSHMVYKHQVASAQTAALAKRFGTSDREAITALAEEYKTLWDAREEARGESERCSASAESLHATLTSNEQAILLEVRRFAPDAFDLSTADALLRQCAQRRRELHEAELAAREARVRLDLLQGQNVPSDVHLPPEMRPPLRRKEVVEHEMAQLKLSFAQARSQADQLSGELRSAGDAVALSSSARQLREQIAALEQEYASIRLAMEVLEKANTDLQNRFSPALGRRCGEIFSALTDGAYDAVVLDRTFRLSAQISGDAQYRDAGFLSAGATDQLYLAARLAICEMVLPEENNIPIVLDDALTNFDDHRCRTALKWLKEEARNRQIILFTCHSREADFFAGDEEVHVQRLTNTAEEV